ncbi:aldo/keto reductase [Tepidanaerobacter acetatoxydans]|uniref:aldo/keto reductase n=1 Tax=Tepidanaerobacter acetatoxydans TaxID=499229 RepID=UPI001BD37EDD|nr:aldo/keto reductase [Tepidanaerobacter acetatoxydans]
MLYKKVGKIKEEISAIGVGCWNFGGQWDTSNDENAIKIVHAAIDNGINLFDVAPVYGFGKAERVLGKALKDGKRSKVLIATKCGLVWNEKHETKNDLSKKNILREIDESLERLQTDYVDIYQLHWPDHNTPIEETVSALEEIKKAGKIRYIGLSNFSQKDVETFMTMIEINTQQALYNMLERNTSSYHNIPLEYKTEDEVLPTVRKYQQAFFPYSPLFQGLLTGKFKPNANFSEKDIRNENPKLRGELFKKYYEGVVALEKFADKIGKLLNEIALNWLRQKDEVTSIIAGASSVAQLEKNVHSTTWDLSQEELSEIETIIEPYRYM